VWNGIKQLTSRDDQLCQTEGSALQNGTSDSDKSSHEDSIASSKPVPKVHCAKTAEGSTEIQGSDGRSLDQRVVGFDRSVSGRYIDLWKLGVNRVVASDATKEGKRETHGEKNGYNNAEIHEPLKRLPSFAQKGVHLAVWSKAVGGGREATRGARYLLPRLSRWKESGPLGLYSDRKSDWKTHAPRPVACKLYVATQTARFPSGPNYGKTSQTVDRSSGIYQAGVKRGCSLGLVECYGDFASSDNDNPYELGAPFW
jgi:hypothetical protein